MQGNWKKTQKKSVRYLLE